MRAYAPPKSCAKAAQAGRQKPALIGVHRRYLKRRFCMRRITFMSEDRGHPQGWPLPIRRFSDPAVPRSPLSESSSESPLF